jgi:hypothetical protein
MGTTAGGAGLVFEVLIGADDALEVLAGEEALGAFAGDFVHRVDEEDFSAPGLGLLRAADDDAGFPGRVVKELRTDGRADQVSMRMRTPSSSSLSRCCKHARVAWSSART